MKILIVSNEFQSEKRQGNPIITRIMNATEKDDRVESVSFCPFYNRLGCFPVIRKAAKEVDLVHIHFGGVYALLVWISLIGVSIPKIITFHGTDIHGKEALTTKSVLAKLRIRLNQLSSLISFFLFDRVGVVSDTLLSYIPHFVYKVKKDIIFVQPLGVDYDLFRIFPKCEALNKLGLKDSNYILFSDKTNTPLKRRDLAEAIVKELGNYELLIMCGVRPEEVPYYINASDFTLLTSDEEGSPNIVRETLALNKRVFAVDVGDVKSQLEGLKNSALINRNPQDAAKVIKNCLSSPYNDNTRTLLKKRMDFSTIILKVVDIYDEVINGIKTGGT